MLHRFVSNASVKFRIIALSFLYLSSQVSPRHHSHLRTSKNERKACSAEGNSSVRGSQTAQQVKDKILLRLSAAPFLYDFPVETSHTRDESLQFFAPQNITPHYR